MTTTMTDNVFSRLDVSSYLNEYLMNKQQPACPFVKAPLKDCYCSSLNSQVVGQALFYCGDHYAQCEIYKNNTQQP